MRALSGADWAVWLPSTVALTRWADWSGVQVGYNVKC